MCAGYTGIGAKWRKRTENTYFFGNFQTFLQPKLFLEAQIEIQLMPE